MLNRFHKIKGERRDRYSCAAAASVCAVALVLGVFACRSAPKQQEPWDTPATPIIWPPSSEQGRIEYIGSMPPGSNQMWGQTFLDRLGGLVLGKQHTRMVKPTAVATNGNGLIAVVDSGVPTVHFFDLNRRRYWRLNEKEAAALSSPVGVAVNRDGLVYVSDSGAGKVFVFEEGKSLVAAIGGGSVERPTGLALSPNETRLHVVDTIACEVVTFDVNGERLSSFGSRGTQPGQFNFPTYIATARDGKICVSDSLNFRVQIFEPDGSFVNMFGRAGDGSGDLPRPKGIGFDSSGRIYVVDAAFENVQIFDQTGRLLLAFGASGTGHGEFSLPCGSFMDSTNTLWVADSFNQRVQIFHLMEDEQQ
jgi:DNA-binding beta-propeller fold protein YncE